MREFKYICEIYILVVEMVGYLIVVCAVYTLLFGVFFS